MSHWKQQHHSEDENKGSSSLKQYGGILLVFGLICLITAWAFNLDTGEKKSFRIFPNESNKTIPLKVAKDNSIYLVVVKQNPKQLPANSGWSFVEITVMSEEGDTLYSFGDEFWQAYGRDYEGYYWSEQKGDYKMKLTFPDKGDYSFEISVDSNISDLSVPIDILILPKKASSLPFSILGAIALIAGGITYYIGMQQEALRMSY